MMRKGKQGIRKKHTWFEKYLPFVARSQEMQLDWLVNAFRKGILTDQEIAPYIRLLLADEGDESRVRLGELLEGLDEMLIGRLVEAAEIYDVPKLLDLISEPTCEQAVIALKKIPPPYEKSPQLVLARIFQTIHARSAQLLQQAAERIRKSGDAPAHFDTEYSRFLEVLEDEKFLSTLYPKARVDFDKGKRRG